MQLYLDAAETRTNNEGNYRAHRVTRPWTRETTWRRADDATLWTSPGGDFAEAGDSIALRGTASGYKPFDVTDIAGAWITGSQDNLGVLVKQNAEQANNSLGFVSEATSNASRWPKLEISYTEPPPPTVVDAGDRDFFTYITEALTDRMSAKVNVGNGNLLLTGTDASVSGVAGLDLMLQRFYNSSLAESSDPSKLGAGWSHGLGGSVRLEFPLADKSRVLFYAPSGFRVRFDQVNATKTGYIRREPGLEGRLEDDGSGNYLVKWHSKDVYRFSSSGRLTYVQDKQGNEIRFNYNGDGTLAYATDTRLRTAVFAL